LGKVFKIKDSYLLSKRYPSNPELSKPLVMIKRVKKFVKIKFKPLENPLELS